MFTQLLGIFVIMASITSAHPGPAPPAPAPTPPASFAVGDNVIANLLGDAGVHNLDKGTYTNAHIWTLDLAKGATDIMTISLWAPPPPGSPVPGSPSSTPTEKVAVSLMTVLIKYKY